MKKEYAFVIPAYNPNKLLLEVVSNIRKNSNHKIFIVDDGSKRENQYVFETLKTDKYKNVILLKHAINRGKGAALKTAFNTILTEFINIEAIVTLDSDGQHSISDCLKVLKELENNNDTFVLGYRTFSKNIPLKSYIGNNVSRFIYKLILGISLKDTQTGLRGLSRDFMKECLSIESNRFEFETEQLVLATNQLNDINIVEVPIETIYIENNNTSSFRPLVDSYKIYFVLLRYFFASILSALIDIFVFTISISFGLSILSSNLWGRSIGLVVNFILLRNIVFKDNSESLKKFVLFICYVYLMGYISAASQEYMNNYLSFSVVIIKILVESMLFIINFSFIQTIIFKMRR